ncbi:hypothetical protein BCR44DRAFT_79218 [Catenaria anguillulae PL171]|uniref:Protein phosphatase 1 regulatory subunit 21 N-terminal domain-containing protein n=1 Tax=Catenaria anguillulae PL171 TaxID=765915 RepID=A0A1Y2HDW9_9FUNG|nr:hypothetical protein BCR44DRAFT_79218 [Catenaria anguillulae PL171]
MQSSFIFTIAMSSPLPPPPPRPSRSRSTSPASAASSSRHSRHSHHSHHSHHTFSTLASTSETATANGNPNPNPNPNRNSNSHSLLLGPGDVSFSSAASTSTANANANATSNEPIAQQLGRAKAHSLVLKKALLQERQRVADLNQQLQAKDAVIRAHAQKLDSMAFHNSTLSRRIEQLQSEFRSGGGSSPLPISGATSARARSPALGLISGLFRPGSSASSRGSTATATSSAAQRELPTGSASSLAQELAATRQLLETTAQELERRIAENEHLQSELADAKAFTLSAQSDALAQRDLAMQDLERAKAQLDLLQVQVQERDRLEVELARGVEMVARLQAEVQQREQGLQAAKEDKALMVKSLGATLSAFMASTYFTSTISASTLADIHAAIIRTAHRSFTTYAHIIRQLIPLVKEKKRPVLLLLNQVLATCPPCLASDKVAILPHREFLVTFFDAYHNLLQEDGTDTSAIAHVKHQIISLATSDSSSTSGWDPEPTRAFLRHSSAHVQVLASTHRPIHGVCSELVAKLAEVGKWIDLYEKLASHKSTLDTLDSPMEGLQHVLDLTAALGEFQVHSLALAAQTTPTAHVLTQVQPSDLIPTASTGSQSTTAPLTDGSTQVDLTSASQSTQTQSRSSLLSSGGSVLRRHSTLHPRAATDGNNNKDDDDVSEGEQLDTVAVDPASTYAKELAAFHTHFDSQLHAALAAAESASARANQLDLTLALRTAELEAQLDAERQRVREARAEAEQARSEVESLREQVKEATDKVKDVEESYAAQLQVVMDEVCRLQEEVVKAREEERDK